MNEHRASVMWQHDSKNVLCSCSQFGGGETPGGGGGEALGLEGEAI